jgi:hypothetical protein
MSRAIAIKARTLRNADVPEKTIMAHFEGRYTSSELDAMIAEMRRYQAQYRKKYYTAAPAELWRGDRVIADPGTLAEREKRLARNHTSLTAALCGDPLPGESALDRRT